MSPLSSEYYVGPQTDPVFDMVAGRRSLPHEGYSSQYVIAVFPIQSIARAAGASEALISCRGDFFGVTVKVPASPRYSRSPGPSGSPMGRLVHGRTARTHPRFAAICGPRARAASTQQAGLAMIHEGMGGNWGYPRGQRIGNSGKDGQLKVCGPLVAQRRKWRDVK